MPKGPIRRAQLIAPFGVGAMVVVRDGTGLIAGGLDHWFEPEHEDGGGTPDPDEFRVEEWRLSRVLGVDHFMLPPDYRICRRRENTPNAYLTVPFLRFPQWHFCPMCYRLEKKPLTLRDKNVRCPECERKGRMINMNQVPFVAICDHGHIQDFPWREWVHKSTAPTCDAPMRLVATGGSTLADQQIICECSEKRGLGGVMEAKPDGISSFLSDGLEPQGTPYRCKGHRPWLGTEEPVACGRALRGSLRSASNVYFAQIKSAIYLPRGTDVVPSELTGILEGPPLSTLVRFAADSDMEVKPELLRKRYPKLLERFSDSQVAAALQLISEESGTAGGHSDEGLLGDDSETAFRRAEYSILREPRDEHELVIRGADLRQYEPEVARFFSRIVLVSRLRETRALAGFTRVYPENDTTLDQRKSLMWRDRPMGTASWLPAYVVYGEGIFIEFSEPLLAEWETGGARDRLDTLVQRYQAASETRPTPPRTYHSS